MSDGQLNSSDKTAADKSAVSVPADSKRSKKLGVKKWAIRIAVAYLLIIVGLVIAEPFLVYPVLLTQTSEPTRLPETGVGFVQQQRIKTEDQVSIDTFHYCPHGNISEARGVFLVCHGNGEWIGRMIPYLVALGNTYQVSVVCFDYRGYGESEGFPYEQGVLLDAEAAYHQVIDWGYPPEKIIVFGRSIGGGPSCYLASRYKIGGLILQNTFSSLVEVASSRFAWLPVSWIMRNRFDSADRLSRYQGPLLQTHGTKDRIVPYRLGKKLFQAAGPPADQKEFITIENGGHNDPISDAFHQKISDFSDRILSSN